jgi:hypothetical protein
MTALLISPAPNEAPSDTARRHGQARRRPAAHRPGQGLPGSSCGTGGRLPDKSPTTVSRAPPVPASPHRHMSAPLSSSGPGPPSQDCVPLSGWGVMAVVWTCCRSGVCGSPSPGPGEVRALPDATRARVMVIRTCPWSPALPHVRSRVGPCTDRCAAGRSAVLPLPPVRVCGRPSPGPGR